MDQTQPAAFISAFMDPTLPSMAAVVAIVQASTDLSAVRRRHLASAIRRFCAALGYNPANVPANHSYFRERLKRFHPLEAGITRKRWQTIKSDVNAALALAGVHKGQTRGLAPLSPEWAVLMRRCDESRHCWGLSRLARYCSNQGIAPEKVNDAVLNKFTDAMRGETFKTNIDQLAREVCLLWNRAVDRVSNSGLRKVTLPSRRKCLTESWANLPVPFRADAEAFLAEMSSDVDLLSETGPVKPLRPASIVSYRYIIRQAHAALVASGVAPEAIASLPTLVTPENAKAILQHFLDRNDGATNSTIHGIAHVLVLIAGPGGRGSEAALALLKTYRKRLVPRHQGLRPRPRNGLRPFADRANIEKILTLPTRILDRMRRQSAYSVADARLMQVAVALELLLMRPIRRKNLAELRLSENIIKSGRETFVRLPPETVKNYADLDYRLPQESAALLDFYVKNLCPLFGPNSSGWLFPGEKEGQPKSAEQLGRFFTKTIRNLTGLYLYPHLTRHFAALVYLRENPGQFEVVRRILAHKSLTTTTRSYASFDDDAAVRLYDNLVLRIRDSIAREVKDD